MLMFLLLLRGRRAISAHSPPDEIPQTRQSSPEIAIKFVPRRGVVVKSRSQVNISSADLPPSAVSWRQSPSPPSPADFVFGATTHTDAWHGWSVRRPCFPPRSSTGPSFPHWADRTHVVVSFFHGAIRRRRHCRNGAKSIDHRKILSHRHRRFLRVKPS